MIASTQNEQIKQLKKLQKAKERKKKKQFLVEGFHLVEEAHQSGWKIERLIAETGVEIPDQLEHLPILEVARHVLKHLSETETPQGLMACVRMEDKPFPESAEKVLICDGIQDPGNLGTMIRTADAAGFDAVLCGSGTVDPYNGKALRSTQGSLFHIPVLAADLLEEIPHLQERGFHIWAAALEESVSYDKAGKKDKLGIIVGNEGAGIRDDVKRLADTIVKIPIYGQAESLNVSVAAGILMYEAQKQPCIEE